MKKLLLLFVFVSVSFFAKAQWYALPDTNLRNALISLGYSPCMNATHDSINSNCSLVQNTRFLNLYNKNIHRLDGILAFGLLDSLDGSYNAIDTISLLPDTMRYFKCSYSKVKSLGNHLPRNLRDLECNNDTLKVLPMLPNSLTILNCFFDSLVALPVLPSKLTDLECAYNQLTLLPRLPDSIQTLYCDYNQLDSIPTLPSNLIDFSCCGNKIITFPLLPNQLHYFECWSNLIRVMPTLPNSLYSIDCSSNYIDSFTFLPNSLISLVCGDNPLHKLPNHLPDSLYSLSCFNDSLSFLPTFPINLKELVCDNNQLHSIPILSNSQLHYLSCSYNPLHQLPLLTSNLYWLYCLSDSLTSIPVLPINLAILYCNQNSLVTLPTLPNRLQSLGCLQNNIQCLPLLPSTLTTLYFDSLIQCLPNAINPTSYSPNFPSTPLCAYYNPHSCPLLSGISGKLYLDYNHNCVDDSSDEVISNVNVRLLDTANHVLQTTNTNVGGWYSFNVSPTQRFIIKADTASLPFIITCPVADTLQANITTTDSIAANKNFAFNCPNGFDVGVQSIYANTDFNPTHNTILNIAAGNLFKRFGVTGCSDAVFNVAVKMTGKVHYQSSAGLIAPTFISANNDSLYWANVAMGADLYNSFIINCKTDSTANAGDVVCFYVNVTPTLGDIDSLNNHASQCFIISKSHDPNYKEASPIGTAAFQQDWLTYTIHFQNTGTAAAHNINVLDTLDSNLEAGTITLLNSSHPTIMQTVGNVAWFIFANINLPDSNQSVANSKGFVQFKIKHKANLPAGTVIKNTADIYFDYNSAVVTNTTRTKNCNNSFATITASICGGAYHFYNKTLAASGTYQDTLSNYTGCDSLVTLHLRVGSQVTTTIHQTICHGDTFNFNHHQYLATGIYHDTLQNYAGCDSIINTNLVVQPAISFGFNFHISGSETFGYWYDSILKQCYIWCNDTCVVSLNKKFANYLWNNVATTDSVKQFFPNFYQETFTVIVTDSNGCKGYDTVVVQSGCEGIESVNQNNVKIYPNPTNQSTVISLQYAVSNITIKLTNLTGQMVIEKQKQSGNQFILDLSQQPQGIYFLHFIGNTEKVMKVVKE